MTSAFFFRLVASEALVIKTLGMVISLKKVATNDVKGLIMEAGSSKFKLPDNFKFGRLGEWDINVKVMDITQF